MAEVVVVYHDPERGEVAVPFSNAWAEEEGNSLVIYGGQEGKVKRLARFDKQSVKSWYINEREG